MTDRIRTLIADDEPAARRGIRLLLEKDPAIEIVAEAATGDEAAGLIASLKPELAFMDIQMPGCDGFRALVRAGSNPPAIVFVTAYDEHALRAFDFSAVDYLLKPYDDERFGAALRRAKEAVRLRRPGAQDSRLQKLLEHIEKGASSDRILVKSGGEIIFLKADEIDWIEAEGDYVKFHASGRSHLMRATMASLEARLDPQRFVRIHRSAFVNADRLRRLIPSVGGDYSVILVDGTRLKLSRGYHARISTILKADRGSV
jgi:two-component system LytT family response regulator